MQTYASSRRGSEPRQRSSLEFRCLRWQVPGALGLKFDHSRIERLVVSTLMLLLASGDTHLNKDNRFHGTNSGRHSSQVFTGAKLELGVNLQVGQQGLELADPLTLFLQTLIQRSRAGARCLRHRTTYVISRENVSVLFSPHPPSRKSECIGNGGRGTLCTFVSRAAL